MAYVLDYYTFMLKLFWIGELIWRLVLLSFFCSNIWMCDWILASNIKLLSVQGKGGGPPLQAKYTSLFNIVVFLAIWLM